MTSLRHIALGCCVLSALAGILRLFWPENGFKSVINAVLVLYILTVGVQLVHGLDWDGLVRALANKLSGNKKKPEEIGCAACPMSRTPPTTPITAGSLRWPPRWMPCARFCGTPESTLRSAGRMAYVSSHPWTRATSPPLRPCSPSMRGTCPGALRRLPHDRPGASGFAGRPAARSAGR